ncbi:TonB-dependent receptor plug domain-containing protein [Desulfovibrionales bacterium]
MQSVMRISLLAILAMMLVPWAGHAQDAQLTEIHVIATPIIEGNQVDSFGASSTVVTREQMTDLSAVDLGTALRRTPGVTISRYNPIGSFGGSEGGGIFIRGMGTSRPGGEIRTFIDGVPMYMSVWNHPLLDLLSIDSADSIQIYKSPQPQVFGNAFAAVNIDPKRMTSEGYATSLTLSGGSFHTFSEQAEHGGKIGMFDYYVGQSLRTSEGHRTKSDGQLTNYFARIGMELGPNWDVSLFGLHTDNFARDPGMDGQEKVTRNGKYETMATMGIASLNHAYDLAEGSIKVFVNDGEGNWYDQLPPSKDLENDFTFYGLRVNELVRPWSGAELTLGLDYDVIKGQLDEDNAAGKQSDWEGPTQRIFSPHLALSQLVGDKDGLYAIPSAGLRAYTHSDFDEEIAPHAGLIVGYKKTQLHAGYARGVLYPGLEVVTLSEYSMPALGRSWKNLNAETLDHYEVGIAHTWDRVRADLTLFWDQGKDRYLVVPPPPPPPMYANVGEYRTRGVESTISIMPTDTLSLFFGLTLLHSDQETKPYTPDTTLSAGLNWRFLEHFKLSLDSQYVSKMYVASQARRNGAKNAKEIDSYFLVNGKVSYELPVDVWGMNAELFLAGENLIDEKYEYAPGYPMPGINGVLGVNVQF